LGFIVAATEGWLEIFEMYADTRGTSEADREGRGRMSEGLRREGD
jgi:hypothetical protein